MSFIIKCPKCKADRWFEKVEYTSEYLVVSCEDCSKRLHTLIDWRKDFE
jgi:ribosomal protein S27E